MWSQQLLDIITVQNKNADYFHASGVIDFQNCLDRINLLHAKSWKTFLYILTGRIFMSTAMSIQCLRYNRYLWCVWVKIARFAYRCSLGLQAACVSFTNITDAKGSQSLLLQLDTSWLWSIQERKLNWVDFFFTSMKYTLAWTCLWKDIDVKCLFLVCFALESAYGIMESLPMSCITTFTVVPAELDSCLWDLVLACDVFEAGTVVWESMQMALLCLALIAMCLWLIAKDPFLSE